MKLRGEKGDRASSNSKSTKLVERKAVTVYRILQCLGSKDCRREKFKLKVKNQIGTGTTKLEK